MTYEEFTQRDMELQVQINSYRYDNEIKKAEIAMNNREIITLEFQQKQLRNEYALSEFKRTPTRGLCGNIIPEE